MISLHKSLLLGNQRFRSVSNFGWCLCSRLIARFDVRSVVAILKTWFTPGPVQCIDPTVHKMADDFLSSPALEPYHMQAQPILQCIHKLVRTKGVLKDYS